MSGAQWFAVVTGAFWLMLGATAWNKAPRFDSAAIICFTLGAWGLAAALY